MVFVEQLDRSQFARAFGLAYYFHPDRETARQIATRAVANLRLAERVQARRSYYRPRGWRQVPGALGLRRRTKVSLERAQLLQRLVLYESDCLELRVDAGALSERISDDQFVLSFVKYLVWNASRRNSLYVATAIGRILHNYSTAEVQGLFSTIVQDPERVPDDSYVRAVKQKLFHDARRRYGGALRTRVAARGEEVFETVEPSTRLQQLVRSCLERLTPWDTGCPVPARFDAFAQTIRPLRFVGRDADAEHPIEVRRMHSLLHPECLRRLTSGLRLDSPDARLSIPRRFFTQAPPPQENDPGGNRAMPPTIADSDLDELRSLWAHQEDARRRGEPPMRVFIDADGTEQAVLDLLPGASTQFAVDEDALLLEFFLSADRSQPPAALYLLGSEPLLGAVDRGLSVDLGGECRLSLTVTHGFGVGQPTAIAVRVASPRSNLADDGSSEPQDRRHFSPWWVRAVGPAFAVMLVAALFVMHRFGRELPAGPEGPRPEKPVAEASPETTRGRLPAARHVTLQSARRFYIGALTAPDAGAAAQRVNQVLRSSGRFQVAPTPDDADAEIRGQLQSSPADALTPGTCRVELQLVGERGAMLWSAQRTEADCDAAIQRAVDDLVRASQREPSP
jgi:hypothetical protein